ncbi:hypothetical protein MMC18_006344 [Xylographa bjoerkii]|nr:hypothetical protein [Xylographa bjoerkii]
MDGPTVSIIPLYNLTPTPSAPLISTTGGTPSTSTITASAVPINAPRTSSSSLISSLTLVPAKSIFTSIAGPTNTPNGSVPTPDLGTFADQSTSAVMTGAVIGGCLLGGLAIAFFWLLWKLATRKGEMVHPTIRDRLVSAGMLKAAWSSPMHQVQMDPIRPTSWDEVRDSFSDPANPFRDSLTPSTASGSRISEDIALDGGHQETAELRSERLDRLFRRSHSPAPSERHGINGHSFGAFRNGYSMDLLPSPRSNTLVPLPPILKRASTPTPLFTSREPFSPPPSSQMRLSKNDSTLSRPLKSPLRSPLKSPLKSPHKQSGTMLSQNPSANFLSATTLTTKKEVRFGGTQVKEFGRTPYASTVNSVAEEFKDEDLTI